MMTRIDDDADGSMCTRPSAAPRDLPRQHAVTPHRMTCRSLAPPAAAACRRRLRPPPCRRAADNILSQQWNEGRCHGAVTQMDTEPRQPAPAASDSQRRKTRGAAPGARWQAALDVVASVGCGHRKEVKLTQGENKAHPFWESRAGHLPGCSTLPSNASSLSPFFAARRSAKLAEGACVHARGACRPWPIPQRFAQRACSSGLGSKARVRSLRGFPDQRLRPTSALLPSRQSLECELAILPMSQYTSTSDRFVRTEWFQSLEVPVDIARK